jgi:catechol 2,3-dioxygenase-like lactoylglutathione lyase family enzyme
MHFDHVVLWVEDPLRAAAFYEEVLGFPVVRLEEFRAGAAPFPSVRVSEGTILDLMSKFAAPVVDAVSGSPGSAGHPVNHICFSMTASELDALLARLSARGIEPSSMMTQSFGARGLATRAFYFRDPDGNVLEGRCYE